LTIPFQEILLLLDENQIEKPRSIKATYQLAYKTLIKRQDLIISSLYIKDFMLAYHTREKFNGYQPRYQTSTILSSSAKEIRELTGLLGLSVIRKDRLIRILSHLGLLIPDISFLDLLPKESLGLIASCLDSRGITTFRLISKRISELFKESEITELLRWVLGRKTSFDLTTYRRPELDWFGLIERNKNRMAAGDGFILFIMSPDKIGCSGTNFHGEVGLDKIYRSTFGFEITPNLKNIKAVAAGANHSLALDYQGRVHSFGRNHQGQLGLDHYHDTNVPTLIPGLEKITAIFAHGNSSFALNDQGQVYEFGFLINGVPSLRTARSISTKNCIPIPRLVKIERVVKVIPGDDCCFFLTADGLGFGRGNGGSRMGMVAFGRYPTPICLQFPDNTVDLQVSKKYTCFLNNIGEVYILGNLGADTEFTEDRQFILPVRIMSLKGIISMTITDRSFQFFDNQGRVFEVEEINLRNHLKGNIEPPIIGTKIIGIQGSPHNPMTSTINKAGRLITPVPRVDYADGVEIY
jgi:hypothetical protein